MNGQERTAGDASGVQDGNNAGASSDRRGFLGAATSTVLMGGGLAASYGMFGVMAGRFLFPAGEGPRAWLFLASTDSLKPGEAITYSGPTGAQVVVARQGAGNTAEDFIALSSVCPHLGCQVHWEAVNDRFFCPCHNGAFDRTGQPIEGPPAAAGQELMRFPLKVVNDLLFIEMPLDSVGNGPAMACRDRMKTNGQGKLS